VSAETAHAGVALIGDYVDAVDRGDSVRLAALFTEEGVLEIGGASFDAGRYAGRAAIRKRFEDSGRAFATLSSATRVRHHVSSIRVRTRADDELVADSYFLAVTDSGPDHWGRYRDIIVRTGEGWLFASRTVVHEGSNAGSFVEVLPR
jgi:ketosteroid isomerase-like protein